jgi:hypothetical protein
MNPEAKIQEPELKRLAPAKSFEQLIVWQKAHQFVLGVYRFTDNFPRNEIYALASQLRRAAVSIPANIVQGSLEECRYYLILAKDLNYGETAQLQPQIEEVSKLLEAYSAKILASGS